MRRTSVLLVVVASALLVGAFATPAGAAPKPKALKMLPTWSYVGPRAPLVGATVRLTDRTGKRIATCRSGANGTCLLDLRRVRSVRLPLEVSTTGGTVVGARFRGHLRARAFDATMKAGVVQLSVISTAAAGMAADRRGYERAVRRVRTTLGIPTSAPADVLRLRNGHVGFRELARAMVRAGGFDAFAADLAKLAEDGRRVRNLRPANVNTSGAVRVRIVKGKARASARQSSGATCTYPIPTGTGGSSTSTEIISDVTQIGTATLLDAAGIPEADMIVGMALAPLGSGSSTTDAQLNAIVNDLNCISEMLGYLSTAVGNLQEAVDVDTASTCKGALTGPYAWTGYTFLINNADTYPITSSNTTLTSAYLPTWQQIQATCGGQIDQMLFGTSTGSGSAWQQLVANTLGSGKWYTQAQVQQLQTFLSTWAMYAYQQMVLTNEWSNYNGAFEAAQGAAGIAVTTVNGQVQAQTDAAGNVLCAKGSSSSTNTYCVWANNIAKAYPPTLYSDEIGTVTTGNAVNSIPGGMVAPAPFANAQNAAKATSLRDTNSSANLSAAATAMNPGWAWNYFLNFTPYSLQTNRLTMYYFNGSAPTCSGDKVGSCPIAGQTVPNFHQNAITWFANQGVNPNGYGSAVQTFQNPQVTARQAAAWSDVSDLGSAGAGGQSATTVLYWAVNQLGGSYQPWSSISASQVMYMTADSSSYFEAYYGGALSPTSITWESNLGSTKSGYNPSAPKSIPATPVFSFLTKRTWWPGASTAKTYTRPTPPMPS